MAEAFFSPCPRGLEALLVDELRSFGAKGAQAVHGGVAWQGDWAACHRANLESRLATRVMWQVAQGRYRAQERRKVTAKAKTIGLPTARRGMNPHVRQCGERPTSSDCRAT